MHNIIGCQTLTALQVLPSETLWLDDEGLYVPDQVYFEVLSYPQPLPGRGLVLGLDERTDSTDTKTNVEFWQRIVSWPQVEFDHIDITEGTTEMFGEPMLEIRQTARFRPKHEDGKS
jgi:hypothetical protein